MNRTEWLKERLNGIGASDAAAIVGLSPYMTNEELWEIKTRRRIAEDISDKPYVEYGNNAEQHLRALFALDFPEYQVGYEEFKIIRNPDYPFIFATLDGWLDDESGRCGILEIKTTEIMQGGQWDKWKDRIPDNYYCQCIWQLLVTGYDFLVLKAQIKWRKDGEINLTTRHYHIERSEVEDDIERLKNEAIKFWSYVEKDIRPPLTLPSI